MDIQAAKDIMVAVVIQVVRVYRDTQAVRVILDIQVAAAIQVVQDMPDQLVTLVHLVTLDHRVIPVV